MKSIFIILITSICFPFERQYNNISLARHEISHQFSLNNVDEDSSQSIRIINGSSLKRLPRIIKDLSAALNKSIFQSETILNKNGFAVYLYDVTCNSFENAAAVKYQVSDTIFHLKLNRYNRQVTDKALAATLIHELMHCVLLDIFNHARNGDKKALTTIASFGTNGNDTSVVFKIHFFNLINSGDAGQHELIYQIFYDRMVTLLESFAEIHHESSLNHKQAEQLMWSGLQETPAYKKLKEGDKREIETTILEAKRVHVNMEEY
jgi:hypothetical protein